MGEKQIKGYDFETPNAKTMAQMDSFLQESKQSVQWDRAVMYLYVGGEGWENSKIESPDKFAQAWNTAIEYCQRGGYTWQEIAEY